MKVFYDGYGIGCEVKDSKYLIDALSKSKPLEQEAIYITGFFYLDERQNKRFELIGDLEIKYFTGVLLDDGIEFF